MKYHLRTYNLHQKNPVMTVIVRVYCAKTKSLNGSTNVNHGFFNDLILFSRRVGIIYVALYCLSARKSFEEKEYYNLGIFL